MEIELGIGMFGDVSYDPQSNTYQNPGERLKQIVEQVKKADTLGLDVFAMGEHHREDYAVSAPEIILSAIASVTKNIKLSSGVSVVSSVDPVKLYQDFSMLDLLSDQRAEIMAGRGSFIESFPLFGYDLNDYNELFEEKLNLLLHLNNNKTINWEGKFRTPIKNQTIYPHPGRKLPVWIAVGGTPASVLRAAKLGLPIMFAIIGGQPKQFTPLIEYYKENYIAHGHDPKEMQLGVHTHTFIGDSKEAVLKDYYPVYAHQMNKIGRERGWGSAYTEQQFLAGAGKEGALFMGSSDEVAEKIINIIELFGLTRYVAHLDTGGPSHKQMLDNIERYATEVVPKVRKHFDDK